MAALLLVRRIGAAPHAALAYLRARFVGVGAVRLEAFSPDEMTLVHAESGTKVTVRVRADAEGCMLEVRRPAREDSPGAAALAVLVFLGGLGVAAWFSLATAIVVAVFAGSSRRSYGCADSRSTRPRRQPPRRSWRRSTRC